ncbi:MAG TPA: porphobilinogen synthase [Candidatus Limnocylindria bacterium]|nr:porphobilinogen synthase [Candidatus Limnocylindria bacterium]
MIVTADRAGTLRRTRRLRRTAALRSLVRETRLDPRSLVLPVFIDANARAEIPIASMPGQSRWPVSAAASLAARASEAGLGGLLVFGLPEEKDDRGEAAADPLGPVASALRAMRAAAPDAVLIADVCLCEYTTHGHCGVIRDGDIDNDATLPVLAAAAATYAEAGADIVAPSDMMDGRVAAIRRALDARGLERTAILSYAAKFASSFYGPFRDAADCAPQFGDRAGYQMDPANGREALLECAIDLEEGADALMVKPAGPYLDVIAAASARFDVPIAAYQVSGEYAALHAAAAAGWLDLRRAAIESLTGIARAGADITITYFALEAAEWLRG